MFRQQFSAIFWSKKGIFLPKKEKLGFQRPSGGVFSAKKGNLGVPEAIRWLTNLFTNSNVVQVLLIERRYCCSVVTVNNNNSVEVPTLRFSNGVSVVR